MVDVLSSALSGMSEIFVGMKLAFTWFLFLSPLIIGFFVFLYLSSFKHTIVLRKKTKDKTDIVTITKFKILNKKGEPPAIKTLKGRHTLPIPPDLAQEMTSKGRIFCECYLSEGGEATFLEITAKVETTKVKEKLLAPLYDKKGKLMRDDNENPMYTEIEQDVLKEIKLTRLKTEDKAFYFNREQKAHEKYKQNNIWSFLTQHGGTLAFIIFVGMIFIFWGDIMQPAIEIAKQNQVYQQNDQRTLQEWSKLVDRMDQIINEKQTLEAERQFNVTTPLPRAPE